MTALFVAITLTLTLQVPAPGAGAEARSRSLLAERETIRAAEETKLTALSRRLSEAGQAAEAKDVLAAIEAPAPSTGPLRFVPLSELVPARAKPSNPPAWQVDLDRIRRESAKGLVTLAAKAAAPGADQLALADECLRAALARDPDQPEARRLLGFVPFEKGWATPHAVELSKADMVLDPNFDWVPRSWVPQLQRGFLPGKNVRGPRVGEWLPADQANALRADIARGWQITTTPHFFIQTDVPLAEAIAFGRRLEALHDIFFSLFADVIGPTRLPLALRYRASDAKATPPKKAEKHQVYYFATRDEYIDYMKSRHRRDERESIGVYLTPGMIQEQKTLGRSFFFRDPGGQLDVTATLYHEVSHQLLFESAGKTSYDKNRGQFWVWEGLGTYFETLEPQGDGSILLGRPAGPRIDAARQRLLDGKRFVPIAEFSALDDHGFNDKVDDRVYDHYAEAMALTIYLLHAEGGRYRGPFLDYVADAYRGRLRQAPAKRSLEKALDVAPDSLDQPFLRWLKADPIPKAR